MRIFLLIILSFFFLQCESIKDPKGLEITMVNFDKVPENYISSSIQTLQKNFKIDTIHLVPSNLPKETFYAPRNRYRADKLIKHLKEEYSTQKVIGITTKDISTTSGKHEDWGIMGLAYRPGKSCIVSTHRTFRGAKNESHKQERLAKVVTHEFGHTLGLPHCKNSETCVMRDANGKVSTVDEVNEFCSSCRNQIRQFLQD